MSLLLREPSVVRARDAEESRRASATSAMSGCCCCHGDVLTHDEHVAAEAELVEFGLNWWHTTRPTHDGAPRVTWTATDVPLTSLSSTPPSIHTLEYSCGAPKDGAPALVMLHGFGFGAALYYAAAPQLATEWPGRVFCIDQLGCGLSSRPPWPLPYGHRCPVDKVEAYFVDTFEAWRAALSLDTIVLLGHSIGGYIAAAYAERHPDRIRQLVLASPAGVPHPPEGLAEVHAKAPRVLKLVRSLVRRGWSPMLLSKDLGLGRRMLTNYMTRRFGDDQAWIAKPQLIRYLLGIWCRSPKSAGGYMVQALMAFGGIPKGSQGEFVYARHPLADRILALARAVPRVSLVYGEFDWMFWRNGADVAWAQQAGQSQQAVEAQQAQPGGDAGAPIDVWRVAQGTHQHMIDNPRGFADAVLAATRGADGDDGAALVTAPLGAGFGRHYGAHAKIFKRASGVKLPQDEDYIEIWAPGQ